MSRIADAHSQKVKIYQLFKKITLAEFENSEVEDIFSLILTLYMLNPRLSYFTVSEYVIQEYQKDDSVTSVLPMQFNIFLDKIPLTGSITSKYSEDEIKSVVKLTLKILDHIELERIRLDNLLMNNENGFANFFNKANDELQKNFQELNNRIDRIDTGAVAILGIFSAVVISVFGTLNIFSSVIVAADSLSIPRLLFILAFSGLVIFDIIFLLLFTISKFTKTPLEKRPSKSRDLINSFKAINENPSKPIDNLYEDFKGFYRKFPYVFYFNLLMLGMIILSVILWYWNKYHFSFL